MKPSIASDCGNFVFVSAPLSRVNRLRKAVYNAGEEIDRQLPGWRPSMITLTYKNTYDWKPNHVRDFLQRVRMYMKRKGFSFHYVWVAELQERGAIHYHILVWHPPVGLDWLRLPKPDVRGWWPHGSTEIAWAKKKTGYLMKYASKGMNSLGFPKGARIYGYSRCFPSVVERVSYWRAPKWVRQNFPTYHNCYLVRKYNGYVNNYTGEFFETPLQFKFYGYSRKYRGVFLQKVSLTTPAYLEVGFLHNVKEFVQCALKL